MKGYVPKTKIICTLGPASLNITTLRKMMLRGMDIVRINFSHGTNDQRVLAVTLVRALNAKYRRRIKILGDLEGPRIRVGRFKGQKERFLKNGSTVQFVKDHAAAGDAIPIDYDGPLSPIGNASRIFLDDGNIILEVKDANDGRIKARVLVGGILKERKAINVEGVSLRFPPISEQDKNDIEFALENRFDYIAQSFVQKARDILEVRKLVKPSLSKCGIIAKIENRNGVKNINSIIKVSDGIMVARGDLGICIPIHEVPFTQKNIIKLCNRKRVLAITATQMLEHMVQYRTPTRAEVSDVANAVIDGTDCVMLSAETAVGKYPAEAVSMMNNIIRFTELNSKRRRR